MKKGKWFFFPAKWKKKTVMLIMGTGVSPLLFYAHAQQSSSQVWYTYNHQAIISNHWGYMFDLNHRTAGIDAQTSVLSAARAGVTWLTDRNHRFSAGYAWFGTHAQQAAKAILHENRLWEQYQVFRNAGKTALFHRIRTEQRWRELTPVNGSTRGAKNFTFRARYMYQHQGPIWPLTRERKFGLWWQGASEIMFHAGEGVGTHYFEQLRVIGGVILMPSRTLNLAVLYQYINQFRPATELHYNIHSIRLTLMHQLDFSKENKKNGVNLPVKNDE